MCWTRPEPRCPSRHWKPPWGGGWRRATHERRGMSAVCVVPRRCGECAVASGGAVKSGTFLNASRRRPTTRCSKAVRVGSLGAMWGQRTLVSMRHLGAAMLVSSVPLLTVVFWRPRHVMSADRSRVTRRRAIRAAPSQLKRPTMAETRNRRPSATAPKAKSRLHPHWVEPPHAGLPSATVD